MDEDKKKVVMIVIVVICITLAAGITYWTNRGGGGHSGAKSNVILKCVNPDCGEVIELSAKEFREKMQELGPEGMMMGPMAGPMALECPACGKKSCFIAEKCEKCGEAFIPNYNPKNKDYPDRCPKCGYSKYEEMRNKRKASK